jgi:hypothetical protein
MNPNSANQLWSKWVWFVRPAKGVSAAGNVIPRTWNECLSNIARFGRKAFGSASQMNVRQTGRGYIIEVLTEGHPVHDPQFVEHMRQSWDQFFKSGFGLSTTTKMTAKLMAGSRQDGSPSDQLVVLPSLTIHDECTEAFNGKRTVQHVQGRSARQAL